MFYLRHFKNFAEAELDDTRPVTLLIGPNGAGKSNLIEAIELLSFLAEGHPLHEVTDIGREGGLEVRGGLEACPQFGQESFTLGHRTKMRIGGEWQWVEYEITVRAGSEPRIVGEVLKIETRDIPIFEVLSGFRGTASADNLVRYDNYARGKNKPEEAVAADRSALSQYARFASGNQKLPETLKIIDAVSASLRAPLVYDPVPKLMRDYIRDSGTRLARNGFNISPVLKMLHRDRIVRAGSPGKLPRLIKVKHDPEPPRQILTRIAQLPDEPFKSFEFIDTKAGDVMFAFKTAHSDKPVTARVLSDGTLRALGILTALETAREGQHLIFEEIDNGVHPSRTHLLSEALFDCAERHNIHVLATTHNPATLNVITPEQLGSVLLVVPNTGKKSAQLLPLKELPGYIEFVEQGRLGDLVTRRVYERHLQGDYEADRQKDIEKWIKALP